MPRTDPAAATPPAVDSEAATTSAGADDAGSAEGTDELRPAPALRALGLSAGSSSAAQTWILGGLLALLALGAMYLARTILLPIFLALFLTSLLGGFVDRLQRLRVPRGLGAAVALLALVAVVAVAVYFLSAPLQAWVERGPRIPYETERKITELIEGAKAAKEQVEELANGGDAAAANGEDAGGSPPQAFSISEVTSYLLGPVTSLTGTLATAGVLVFFFLAVGPQSLRSFTTGLHNRTRARLFEEVISDLRTGIASYIRTITIINAGLGLAVWAVLSLLEMPNPVLWGAVVGVSNFMPFIGPTISLALIAAVSLLSFDSWATIVLPPLGVLSLNILESQFVTPYFVGRRLHLNPLAVILSILFWAWMWGAVGAVLAVPMLVGIKLVAGRIRHFRALGNALDDV